MTTIELEQYIADNLPKDHDSWLSHTLRRHLFDGMKLRQDWSLIVGRRCTTLAKLQVSASSPEMIRQKFDDWLTRMPDNRLISNPDFVACEL